MLPQPQGELCPPAAGPPTNLAQRDAAADPTAAPNREGPAAPAAGPRPVRLSVRPCGHTLVDAEDAARLQEVPLRWDARGYVVTADHKGIQLSRIITGAPPGTQVHHRRAKWNNRRRHLLVLSPAEHCLVEPRHRGAVSGWLGVYPDHGRWCVMVGFQRRRHCASGFGTAVEAALARDEIVRGIAPPGVPAALNFPRTVTPGHLRACLARARGRPFRVVFRPRGGGPPRDMTCRLPEPPETAARPPRIACGAHRLLQVIDTEINEYRFIPLEGVLCFEDRKVWHRIGPPPRASTGSATSSARTAA